MYGLPSGPPSPDEHVRLGGCCVMVGESPDYHCNECGIEWSAGESYDGRRRLRVDGVDPYGDLQTVEAWVGEFTGPSYRVVIDLVFGRSTWNAEGPDLDPGAEPTIRSLRPEEVGAFRDELRDVNPLGGKARYDRPGVMDGTSWAVTIQRGSAPPCASESNAYPRTWRGFYRLLQSTTVREFM